jgi:hypothetical protein
MSQQLIEKTKTFINSALLLKEPHDVIKLLIEMNILIDGLFDAVLKDDQKIDELSKLLFQVQKASLFLYMNVQNEMHKVRGNIIASLCSLIFVTQSKIILLINDEEWCDLDQFYREKSEYFFKDDFFQTDTFEQHHLTYQSKHPLVQYSMMNCKTTLFEILSTTKSYGTVDELAFIQLMYDSVRNRVAIVSNYAYSQDVNDIAEYVVRINNNRAIPTSSFLYDFGILCREVERNLLCFKTFHQTRSAEVDYEQFLTQVKPTYLKWAASMIVTAAGDDFCSLFGKFYCKAHTLHFEKLLYRRKFPSVRIIYYKLLQTTRGMNVANELMQRGNDFVVDLLKREETEDDEQDELDLDDPDSMCSSEVVLSRMETLSTDDFNIILMGIIDYVTERQWNRTVETFFTRSFEPDVSLEPALLKLPFTSIIVLFTKSQQPVAFSSFYEAFAAWAYHLQRDYEGLLYDKKTGEKTLCTSQLKKIFAL